MCKLNFWNCRLALCFFEFVCNLKIYIERKRDLPSVGWLWFSFTCGRDPNNPIHWFTPQVSKYLEPSLAASRDMSRKLESEVELGLNARHFDGVTLWQLHARATTLCPCVTTGCDRGSLEESETVCARSFCPSVAHSLRPSYRPTDLCLRVTKPR